MPSTIVWFRKDLRLADNPAWARALDLGLPILPLYIHDSGGEGDWALGEASQWWLHHALVDLNDSLQKLGGGLIIRRGEARKVLEEAAGQCGAENLFWNRRYEPFRVKLDASLKSHFKDKGLNVWSGNASLLHEPWEVSSQSGNPYKVYTPFRKTCAELKTASPVTPKQGKFSMARQGKDTLKIKGLELLPKLDWADGFSDYWTPTRRGGLARLNRFLDGAMLSYKDKRDFPAEDGTSRLSPYLHWGQIGVREVLEKIQPKMKGKGVQTFYHELLWREFAYHVLYHFPHTPEKALQEKYQDFPWLEDADQLQAWQRGRTGYPMVDAGMRQLWQKGWMHNRVRMIVGSLLVKHLLQPWQDGARWFWDCLVDADLASNTLGWQWAGGCGADAAPYFRVFNPMTQGEKFDSSGSYVREFVPELGELPEEYIHQPWEAPSSVLEKAGVKLDKTYPRPIIGHKEGRERALKAFEMFKQS